MLSPLINDKKNQTENLKKNYLNTCSVGGYQKQFYVHVSVIYQTNLTSGKRFSLYVCSYNQNSIFFPQIYPKSVKLRLS